jgi:flagellar biosynthesis repressor protein FlbT
MTGRVRCFGWPHTARRTYAGRMTKRFRIALKAGERLYLNGALIRADRKVTLELLNDAVFLLDAHIMMPEHATTPLQLLYLEVQTLLTDSRTGEAQRQACADAITALKASAATSTVLLGLGAVSEFLATDRALDALKTLRVLIEMDALQPAPASSQRSQTLA